MSRTASSAVVAGIRGLVGEPLRALATTGFTLNRGLTLRRARLAYLTPQGAHAVIELDPAALTRLDIPVEPAWVRCVHGGPCPDGTVESLAVELEISRPRGLADGRLAHNSLVGVQQQHRQQSPHQSRTKVWEPPQCEAPGR